MTTDATVPPAAADAPHPPLPPADERRNFRLGVVNGSVFAAGEALMDPATVLAAVLASLTRSGVLIGLAAALPELGWMLPQVFVAPWASRQPRQLPLYRRMAVVRGACLLAIAAAAWLLRAHPPLLLAVFFALYATYHLCGGVSAIAFMELVGRTVRPGRLGAFFARRLFWGGILGALGGVIARRVLEVGDAGTRLAVLFTLAGMVCSAALAAFAVVREPAAPAHPTPPTPLALLRRGVTWMRHEPAFRRLFLARATQSLWSTAAPFLTLFVMGPLGGGGRAAASLLVARLAGYVLSNLAWQRLSHRTGNRAIMRVATGLACVLLFASAIVAYLSPWRLGVVTGAAALVLFHAVATLGGAATSGLSIDYNALVLETAPHGDRQSFVSLINAFLAPTTLLPVLGGVVVDTFDAPALFLACGLTGIVGYRAATRLPAPHTPETA